MAETDGPEPDDDRGDPLAWTLGAIEPVAAPPDYRVFATAFVEGRHPAVAQPKRFSLILAGDWVNIIPLTRDDHVVIIRQFRPGTARVQIEIPGGMVDPGEAPAAAAARELAEETGYTVAPANLRYLGRCALALYVENTIIGWMRLAGIRHQSQKAKLRPCFMVRRNKCPFALAPHDQIFS